VLSPIAAKGEVDRKSDETSVGRERAVNGNGPPPFGELLAVFPVRCRLEKRLLIVTAESYEDAVVVRWVLEGEQVEEGAPPPLALRDDAGTTYRLSASGWFGDARRARGETTFEPGIPASATTLEIVGGGAAGAFVTLRR
jgi:hypothetical protein